MAWFQCTKRTGKDNDCCKLCVHCAHFFLQIILFVPFLLFFGIPSVEKYLEKQTIIISSEKQTNGIEAPAITFAALKKQGVPMGWKSVDKDLNLRSFVMLDHCHSLNFSNIDACQKNDTFARDDFMRSAQIGFYQENSTSLLNDYSWTEDLTTTTFGRYFTLNPSRRITGSPDDALMFKLYNGFSYFIWVHDEDFFILNQNPRGLPSKLWKIDNLKNADKDGLYHEISLTKHKKLNLDRRPCNEGPSHSFTTCVKENLAERFGCRMPWDLWSNQDRAVCTTRDAFRQLETLYKTLRHADVDKIVATTGCIQPCTYNEYKFAFTNPKVLPKPDHEISSENETFVAFWAMSDKTFTEVEVLLYPFTSLIAEFGGALGLFFGFSFMTIWQEVRGCCCK